MASFKGYNFYKPMGTICSEFSTNKASQEEQPIWAIIEKVWRHGNLWNASAQIRWSRVFSCVLSVCGGVTFKHGNVA